MAKFHGILGYITDAETAPSVYSPVVTEIPCNGDILRNNQRWEKSETLNENLRIDNRFSFVGDAYAHANFSYIRWISWNDVKWRVTSIEIQYPRLILSVSGVYNG